MKVSGFTFVRNAVKYEYPVTESIRSILPLCDEVIVAVGNSDDGTRELIESIGSPKILIIDTVWDDSLREGGKVLAVETNKALDAVSKDSDWCFYAQADEVFHEKDHAAIKEGMEKWKDEKQIEGLLFDHINFYGSYDYLADSHKWHKKEVRIIRNDPEIRSYKDAMSFRKGEEKLSVKKINATIYHYGWVRPPKAQQARQREFHKMWHDDDWVNKNVSDASDFDYSKIDVLTHFKGTHPQVMKDRINKMNWKFTFDPTKGVKPSLRIRLINLIHKNFGWHIGEFKNYKLV